MKNDIRKKVRRLLAVVLSAALLFGALPVWSAGAVSAAQSAVVGYEENPNDNRPLDDDDPTPSTPPSESQQGFAALADGTWKLLYDNSNNAYLPSSYQGVPVTAIGDNAYMGKDITWAIIPGTVTTIGNYAFADCKQLNEVIIPLSVTSIGEGAFDGCPNLRLKLGAGTAAEDYAVRYQIPYVVQSITDFRINSVIYNSEDAEVFFFDAQGTRVNLTKNADYTMEYTYDPEKAEATLVVRGKGMYTGEYVEKQQIGGRFPIGNQTLLLSQDAYTYDGTAKTPAVSVYFECPVPVPLKDDRDPIPFEDEIGDLTDPTSPSSGQGEPEYVRHYLVRDRDYTVSYRNNTNIGLAEAVVTGKGFYTGSAVLPFTISGQVLDSSSVSLSASSYTYDGTAKTPAVTVKAAGKTLTQNTDYTVAYQDNINAGTAKVTVTGMGNFGGSVTKSFTIAKCPLSGASAVLSGSTFVYDGTAKRPTLTLYLNGKALTENTDYTVAYSGNTNVGTATVTATGKGNYQGTVSKTFTIQQAIRPIADCTVTLSQAVYTYDGTRKTPTVTVKYGNTTLTDNDYSVAYSGNINAGKAVVTLTGKGNYTGTKAVEYTIQPKSITAAMVNGESTGYTFAGKQHPYRCTVTDGGKTLTEGTDYDLYCRDNFHAGQASARFTGKGNYAGTVTCYYTISPFSIEGAAFGLPSTLEYDGTAKRPQVKIVYKSGIFLSEEGVEFTVSYQNNVLPGTATVTVTGIGDFTGSVSKTFTITKKTADQFVVELEQYSYIYDGAEKKPAVSVKAGNETLIEGTHYTVSYSDCRNAGTAAAVVTGKGIYSGTKSVSYTISPRHISYATASLSPWRYTYDGTPKTPSLTLRYGSTTLKHETDYTYSHTNNTAPGTGTVNYFGKGNWYGSCFEEFEIEKPATKFTWGQDNWNFTNSSKYFSNLYYVDSNIQNIFQKDFNLDDKTIGELTDCIAAENNEGGWRGSCYGMTTTEMLAKYGMLDLTKYGADAVVTNNTNSRNVISMINCFQWTQSVTGFTNAIRRSEFNVNGNNQAAWLRELESRLKNGDKMVNICFRIAKTYLFDCKDSEGVIHKKDSIVYSGHSILGYGVEICNYTSEETNDTYNRRILIADPNSLTYSDKDKEDFCLYYNSDYSRWIIPAYNYDELANVDGEIKPYRHKTSYWDQRNNFNPYYKRGSLTHLYDYNGDRKVFSIMDSEAANDRYISGLTLTNANCAEATVEQLADNCNTAIRYADSTDTTGVTKYIDYFETEDKQSSNENYALWNPTASYALRYTSPVSINAKMDYKDITYYAELSNSDSVTFSPEGSIEAKGSDTDFSLSLVSNDSECVTGWYKMTVAGGAADSVRLQKTRGGYLLTSDNLKNVTVTANDLDVTAQTAFSTAAKSVYLYEINENTIGVLADMDNNGTFETDLAGDPSFAIGGVSGNGSVSIKDATLLQQYLAEFSGENGRPVLDMADNKVFALADANRDGRINIIDVTYIQRYLARIIQQL